MRETIEITAVDVFFLVCSGSLTAMAFVGALMILGDYAIAWWRNRK